MNGFDEYWGDRGDRWNGILDIKNWSKRIWIDSQKNAWIEIEKHGFPKKQIPVIAYGKNSHNKSRKIKAIYYPAFTKEDEDDYEGDADYSAEKDCFYWPAGWYEWNLSDDINYFVAEIEITHFMYMPESPEV